MPRSKKPRSSITLAEPQKVRLSALATKTGLSESEHVRRALDLYFPHLEAQEAEAKRSKGRGPASSPPAAAPPA